MQLFDRYALDVLVIQDTSKHGTERAQPERRDCCIRYGCPNKQRRAELIAKHIPAFEQYVPPPRKPWMSEDRRIGLFDAAVLALTFFQSIKKQAG